MFIADSTVVAIDRCGRGGVAVNLALLAVPLSDIGKVYTKWREAMPALEKLYWLE
jgi:hypothetical protein